MFDAASDYIVDDKYDPLKLYYYPLLGRLYRRRVEMCLNLLPGGGNVLEVGFGSGVCFPDLSGMYANIYGIDLHSRCEAISTFFAHKGIETNLTNGSVTAMPYADKSFDAVLLISILEHLQPDDLDKAVGEIYRVLKPGGVMVYGVPVERRLMVAAFKFLGHDIRQHHFSTEKDVASAAEKYLAPAQEHKLKLFEIDYLTVYEARRFLKKL
jgi:ubiquinone/menaquinone biosynthesis C-methylase UbiE